MDKKWLSLFTMMDGMDLLETQTAIIDQDGYIIAVNKAWKKFNQENGGVMSTAGTGVNYLNVLEQSEAEAAKKQIKQVLEGQSAYNEYAYTCHSPKKERWYLMKVMPMKKEGQIYGALIQHDNITEKELYKREAAEILESMTDAFYSIDEQLNITYLNSGAASLLKKQKHELLGKNILNLFPEALDTEWYWHYKNVLKTKKTAHFEAYYSTLSTWFESYVYPQKNGGLSVYFKDIRERKKAESQLRRAAYFDELTNLPNRRFFIEHLSNTIELKQKTETKCAVLFMDLDGFKNVNDTLGHDVGDRLLQEVAVRLRSQAEPDHFVGRFGGDEFLIVYKGKVSGQNILQFAEDILTAVKKPIVIEKYSPFSITASIGISLFPGDGETADDLLRKADMAMYQAKKQKGDCSFLFRNELHQHLERRLYIEENLKHAAENDDIFFVYQPQVDARTNKIIGFEVLSRWNSDKLGWISPEEFIHVAEETGLISNLTEKMIQRSFAFIDCLRSSYGFDGFLSVNLSSKLLTNAMFMQEFKKLVQQWNFPKGTIEIEITESVPLFSSANMFKHLEQMRQEGICVAIDDFGTGYSALSYLHDFPLDKIKVDKQFIDQIQISERGEALLSSILHLANSLDLIVIAEGVETEKQRNWLVEKGCYRIQGYYYYKPLQEKEILKLFDIK